MINKFILWTIIISLSIGLLFTGINLNKRQDNDNLIYINNYKISKSDLNFFISDLKFRFSYLKLLSDKIILDIILSQIGNNIDIIKLCNNISKKEIKEAILKNNLFYIDKQFSFNLYKNFLNNIRLDEISYQQYVKKKIKLNKIKYGINLLNKNIYFTKLITVNYHFFKYFDYINYSNIYFNIYHACINDKINFMLVNFSIKYLFNQINLNNFYLREIFFKNILKYNKLFLLKIDYFSICKNFVNYRYFSNKIKSDKDFFKLLYAKNKMSNIVIMKNELNNNFIYFFFKHFNKNILLESKNFLHVIKIKKNLKPYLDINFLYDIKNKFLKKRIKIYFLSDHYKNYIKKINKLNIFFKYNKIYFNLYIKLKYFSKYNSMNELLMKINKYNYIFLYNNISFNNCNFYKDINRYLNQIKIDKHFMFNFFSKSKIRISFYILNNNYINNFLFYNNMLKDFNNKYYYFI